MWRAIVCLCVALTVGFPAISHAQSYDNDSENSKQYTNEDSQPLRLMAYVLSPFGFALEWGIMRPLHYIATDTFLAPVLGGASAPERWTPPVPPLEPEAGSLPPQQPSVAAALPPTEVKPATSAPATPNPVETGSSEPHEQSAPHVPSAPAQPVMH